MIEASQFYFADRVRASVASGRSSWFNERLRAGDWHEIRNFRKSTRMYHGHLTSMGGNVVDSAQHAETFAQYLEQGTVRCSSGHYRACFLHDLGPPLPVSTHVFSEDEVLQAVRVTSLQGWGGLINWLMFEDMLGAFMALMLLLW